MNPSPREVKKVLGSSLAERQPSRQSRGPAQGRVWGRKPGNVAEGNAHRNAHHGPWFCSLPAYCPLDLQQQGFSGLQTPFVYPPSLGWLLWLLGAQLHKPSAFLWDATGNGPQTGAAPQKPPSPSTAEAGRHFAQEWGREASSQGQSKTVQTHQSQAPPKPPGERLLFLREEGVSRLTCFW